MPHEVLVLLHVTDHAEYQRYRDGMTPILARCGGGFRHDFLVERTLRTDAAHPVNRVFTIHFPDRATREAFFADPEYRAVREKHFVPSVGGATVAADWTTA